MLREPSDREGPPLSFAEGLAMGVLGVGAVLGFALAVVSWLR